ncbi:M20 family peptidase [Nitrospinae bacterium AH_259_B05_G02_I21]|nr:M20 family peptidase [Nitrospinae bacterium AH_259_B05_G02_I21]MDA2932103.1 M20 family peptidase [Nitrospinae bacterium AH-259-F20]
MIRKNIISKTILGGIVGLVVVLVSAVGIRTALFTSKQMQVDPKQKVAIDEERIAAHLARAIRFRTISYRNPAKFDPNEFLGLRSHLEQAFPKVHSTLKREVVGDFSLLYTWEGIDPNLKPLLLMGHMDVVPIESGTGDKWTYSPFAGRIADGFIWGRGTMDDKVSVLGILETVELLLAEGFQPRRTVYLAFGHDEEVGGFRGAAKIAALLHDREVELEFTLDEGFAITERILPMIAAPVAMVGIAEKGYLTLQLTVETEKTIGGCGHSSMPQPHTTIGTLSIAIQKLEANPLPARITEPVRQLFEYVGPEMDLVGRIVFANLWLLEPVVKSILARKPSTNALIRTTTAVTMIKGGNKENALPCKAEAVVNFRALPGESNDSVIDHVRMTINNPQIRIRPLNPAAEPSPISNTSSPSFRYLHRTIRQIFPDVVVAPSLTIGGTDSKHYASLSNEVYRFLPLWLKQKEEDTSRFHGTNERIAIEHYADIVRFYVQLIRNSNELHSQEKRNEN